MWHVSSRSGVAALRTAIHLLLTYSSTESCGLGGSVAEWLACWTQAQKGLGSNRSRDADSNSLRQIFHTHPASVHQAAKLVAALLRVARVTAGLVESNGISSGTLRSVNEYGLTLPFYTSVSDKQWLTSGITEP